MKFIKLILLIAWASMQPLHALDNSAPNPDLPDLSSITGLPPELCNIIADNLDDLSDLIKYQLLKPEPNWSPASISSSVSGDYLAISFRRKDKKQHKVVVWKVNARTSHWEVYKTYDGCSYGTLSPNGKHIALLYHYGRPAFKDSTVKKVATIEDIDGKQLKQCRIYNDFLPINTLSKSIFMWSPDSAQLFGFLDYTLLWKKENNWAGKIKSFGTARPVFIHNKLFFIYLKNDPLNCSIYLEDADEDDNPNSNERILIFKDKYPISEFNAYSCFLHNTNEIGILPLHTERPTLATFDSHRHSATCTISKRSESIFTSSDATLSPDGNFLAYYTYSQKNEHYYIEIYRKDSSNKCFEYKKAIELDGGIKSYDWLSSGKGLIVIQDNDEIEIFVTQGKTLQLKNDRMAFFDLHRSFFKNATLVIGGLIACGLIYYVWSKFSWDDVVGKAATADHTYSPGYPLLTSAFNKLFFTSNPQK